MHPFKDRPAFVYHPDYYVEIGAHVFPIAKYPGTKKALIDAGVTEPEEWIEPPLATREELALVHTPEYLDEFLSGRMGPRTGFSEFPLTPEIVRAYVRGAGGSIVACREALTRGFAANCGGGFHHAFADMAAGFCYLNDIAIGIRVLQREGRIQRAAVVDCDLHQGNGTARIFQDDDSVFTFSIHQENLYPVKEKSDWDIGLEDHAGDERYLDELSRALPRILERARPDFVVYQAGADPFEEDQLGDLGITRPGLRERDRLVISACAQAGVPVAITLGGGYARRLVDTVAIHAGTLTTMLEVWASTKR
ncbi:MAG TPA: histone deacetylase [Candidatus Eisenbacteria bacterium]|nr:histone deacetylase [Candidatus Eisenbacteria bacterium]